MTGPATEAEQLSGPTGERFEPTFMHGRIIEAEHLARYAWIARLAAGRRVLDAACGTGYGAQLIADAGASEVVGVDIDEATVAAASGVVGDGVSLQVGDLHRLPFAEDSFDLIACFEAIEHVADPEPVLDELRRVLRPDGVLALSTPNRDVYAPGNPFHLRELTPSELNGLLEERFANVRLRRQHSWVASAVFRDEVFLAGENSSVGEVEVLKAAANAPGSETYTLALAGDGELPPDRAVVDLSADIDLREWSERLTLADQVIASAPQDARGRESAELTRLRGELASLRLQLARSEAEIGRYVELEGKLEEAKAALGDYVVSAEVVNSLSWRVTRPLRRLSAAIRKLRA
jgi:SAM-dependent methyltransferase